MRLPIAHAVADLPAPDDALLAEARQPPVTASRHARFLDEIAAFHALEGWNPARPQSWPGRLRVAAFNAQRMKDPAAARALLDRAGAHVALLSEVDVGMARSGNRHTLRDLIGGTGAGYAYGVEFVELDLGDKHEMRVHRCERNARSFHGNGIVTRLALSDPHVIPLEENGFWFPGREGAQRRIGGRIAVAARVSGAPRDLWLVAVHLESKTDAADRQAQIRALLAALDGLAPGAACILGGDFNTKDLPRCEEDRPFILAAPEREEPLFADLRRAGFSWDAANAAAPTQRRGPDDKPDPPYGKLDWLAYRGLQADNAAVLPALAGEGRPISDHDMICADFTF